MIEVRRSTIFRQWLPWVAVATLVVLPLFALAAIFSIRAGIWSVDGEVTAGQVTAVFAFLGVGLTATVTLVGALLTFESTRRSREQLMLDTATKSLGLLQTDSREYATKAVVGGSLATLVHLGHPIIAMRTLDAAWIENKIHPSSACWVIGEVLTSHGGASAVEAAALLRANVKKLPGPVEAAYEVHWPLELAQRWPTRTPFRARADLVRALGALVLTRPKLWWGENVGWVVGNLTLAMRRDDSEAIRRSGATLILALTNALEGQRVLDDHSGSATAVRDLRQEALTLGSGDTVQGTKALREALDQWLRDGSSAAQTKGSTKL